MSEIENPEINKESYEEKNVLELFSLTEEETGNLKNEINRSNGLARIFIHPIGNIENSKRVDEVLVRTMTSNQAPPIIVLENDRYKEAWNIALKDKELPKKIYLVPTIYDYPYPKLSDRPEPQRDLNGRIKDEEFNYVEESIKKLIEFLNSIGVKKIFVGGKKLEINEGDLSRCVGNFINFMTRLSDLEIKVSLGTAPLNRSDVRKSHPDLL